MRIVNDVLDVVCLLMETAENFLYDNEAHVIHFIYIYP